MSLVKRLLGIPEGKTLMYGLFSIPGNLEEFADEAKKSGEPVKIISSLVPCLCLDPYPEHALIGIYPLPEIGIIIISGDENYTYYRIPIGTFNKKSLVKNIAERAREELRQMGLEAEVMSSRLTIESV